MADDGSHKVRHIQEMGHISDRGTDMLHQVCSAGRTNTDYGSSCRPKGTYHIRGEVLQVFVTLTTIQRPESNETSLALVSRDHPLVPPSHLGAEASALLDRLLDVFIDKDRCVLPYCRYAVTFLMIAQ